MKHKTGNLFYGELVSRIYSNQDQTVTVGVIRDISERKAAEIALKQSESKFRLLVDEMPAGLYLTDVNGKMYLCKSRLAEDDWSCNLKKLWAMAGKREYTLLIEREFIRTGKK